MPTTISEISRKRLQENLAAFRKIMGYSAEELGVLIGLTRQSITNLETEKTPLTALHYRAICHVISEVYAEKIMNNGSPILSIALTMLMTTEDLENEDYEKFKKILAQLSTLMSEGVVDDPIATLKGLLLSTYELSAGDVVPVDILIDTINSFMKSAANEMEKGLDEAINALPEK